jgi:hypothetical protein
MFKRSFLIFIYSKLRAKLGLKPLEAPGSGTIFFFYSMYISIVAMTTGTHNHTQTSTGFFSNHLQVPIVMIKMSVFAVYLSIYMGVICCDGQLVNVVRNA